MSFGGFQTPSRNADEAEKPFWISYADLMTALMILFLVIMVTSLTAISQQAKEIIEKPEKGDLPDAIPALQPKELKVSETEMRFQEIASICEYLSQKATATNTNVFVDCKLNRINFGEVGRFKTDQYKLGADGEQALGQIVPLILDTANTPLGKKWLKQVLIEGFTDTDGSYLYNLNLSLRRSEWVMCTLLRNDQKSAVSLNSQQRRQIKKLFLAGGVAFNNVRGSKDESRRVELRLQFYGLDKQTIGSADYEAKFDDNATERCMI